MLFVHDATGEIFVKHPADYIKANGTPTPGTVLDITGVSATGEFAPITDEPQIRFVGRSSISLKPRPISFSRLFTGTEDGQWVEIEGVVQSVFETPKNVILEVASPDGRMGATTVKVPGINYARLVDSRVRIRGNAGPLFNTDGQMTSFHIFFPDLAAVTVVEASPIDPFSLPPSPVKSLSLFTPKATWPHRIHLQGKVTLQWPGKLVCIQDGPQGLCAQSSQDIQLHLGELVDVLGFAGNGGYKPSLVDAVVRPMGGTEPTPATIVTPQQAIEGNQDSSLVQIDGQLIGRQLEASDKTLMLSSGKFIFPVILPASFAQQDIPAIRNGSKLRVTGILSLHIDTQSTLRGDGTTVVTSFRVLLRSPQDVVVLQTPSWWTPTRVFILLALVIVITAAVLGWVIVLKRRVYEQTRTIRESEERFRHMAQHDALTGLPTRMLLHDRLHIALERAKRFKTGIALLMLDLDNFKQINDSLGHHAGDLALCATSERIVNMVRSTDTVARMGGDEFLILLTDLDTVGGAETVAKKIVAALSLPIVIGAQEVAISVSVGVCEITDGEIDADVLLKSVDTAMYHAKADGRNCFRTFTRDMESATHRKLHLHQGLKRALEFHEFELHYQPLINFATGKLTGFEALLRWNSELLGHVGPVEFIPIAEESGLIVPIGEWVVHEACRQIGLLERQMKRIFSLAVNLSPRQFLNNHLPQMIEEALVHSGRSARGLTLEITESILMGDSLNSNHALAQLRSLGVQFALDDFGIGFSNLSYITRFPVDWIKIDRSLICNSTTDRTRLAVVRAIVAMAHGLDIQVIAEGIETSEQFALLKNEQCDTAQGFHLGRPTPFNRLRALVESFDHPRSYSGPVEASGQRTPFLIVETT